MLYGNGNFIEFFYVKIFFIVFNYFRLYLEVEIVIEFIYGDMFVFVFFGDGEFDLCSIIQQVKDVG